MNLEVTNLFIDANYPHESKADVRILMGIVGIKEAPAEPASVPAAPFRLSLALVAEILHATKEESFLKTIKAVRNATDMGLMESKKFVEDNWKNFTPVPMVEQ